MTPAEAIEAAELAEAEIRYRHQLASEAAEAAYEQGQVVGYLRAVAEVKAVQRGLVLDAELEACATDREAARISPTPDRATSPAADTGSPSTSPNWRPDDNPPDDPGGDRARRRRLPAVVAVSAHPGTDPET